MIFGLCVISVVVYYGIGWIKEVFGDVVMFIFIVVLLVVYVGLVKIFVFYVKEGLGIDENL